MKIKPNNPSSYEPYTGPSGPTPKQRDSNTLFLRKKLIEVGFDSKYIKVDRGQFAQDNWGGNDVMLKLIHPSKKKCVSYISYDRWGFCAGYDLKNIDQTTLYLTVIYIMEWYNEN